MSVSSCSTTWLSGSASSYVRDAAGWYTLSAMSYAARGAIAFALLMPVTTLMEMAPLMILFELSIWLSVFFERRWKGRDAAREAAFQGGEP